MNRRATAQAAALVLGGVLLATGLAELAARRLLAPPPFADFILAYPVEAPRFRLDPELGYTPRFGDAAPERGYAYDLYGINVDQSVRLDQGGPRILFLGDSVTRQARILRALDAAYAGNRWELLNSGVEGYNVVQEVDYFFRYSVRTHPDRVVITIHNNDLTYFPMTYMSSARDFFWYFPGEPPLLLWRPLYRFSYLYRHFVTWQYLRLEDKVHREHTLPEKTHVALRRLRDWAAGNHVTLQALVLPILRPYTEWTDEEKESRVEALAITRDLGIQTYDLLPPLEEALRDGKVVRFSLETDYWHPNDESAGYFARFLREKKIFAGLPLGPVSAKEHP